MRPLLAAALLLAGCSRPPQAPEGKAVYSDKAARFSLHGPADWRVMEEQGGAHRVTFFGPPPAVESIAVYRHDKGGPGGDAQAYLAGQSLGGKSFARKLEVKGKPARELVVEKKAPVMHGKGGELLRQRTVVLEDEKGFWALVHTAPASQPSSAVFEDSLQSFSARD